MEILVNVIWTVVCFCIVIFVTSVLRGRASKKNAVGFFHPYTNDGGGGERVLWCAVKAIQEEKPDLDCIIYTGDHDASPNSLMARAADRFGIQLLFPPKASNCFIFSVIFKILVSSACGFLYIYVDFWDSI